MPNLTIKPPVKATRAKRAPHRSRGPHAGHAWWQAVKVTFLLQRLRRKPQPKSSSSPSLRQIALVVVSAGIVLVIVRLAVHRGKSHAEVAPSTPPGACGEPTVPANESPLTDTVQQEMSDRSDAVHPDA